MQAWSLRPAAEQALLSDRFLLVLHLVAIRKVPPQLSLPPPTLP